jgi:hypothetical protein
MNPNENANQNTKPSETPIFILWSQWAAGELKVNQRQKAILETWQAFLGEHPEGNMDLVNTIPDALQALYRLADAK